MKVAWAALVLAVAPSAIAQTPDIHLICDGTATVVRSEGTTATGYSDNGHFVTVSGSTAHRVNEDDELLVEVTGSTGRIKLPRRLTPVLHSGSDDGWRKFSSLAVGDTEINGRFDLNFLNHPSVTINRMNGHIDLTALGGSFVGNCQPYSPDVAQRRF